LKRKNILAAAVVVVALAAGYPASSWYFGRQIETAHRQIIDTQIAVLPYVKLIRYDYERGLFKANETITVEIPHGLLTRGRADSEPLRITLKNLIQHGPFPGFSAFGAGRAESVVEFDEEIQKKVLEAFGGKPAAEIRTLYDFGGGGRSTLTSPAFRVTLPGGTEDSQVTLSGEGLELSGEFARGMTQYSTRGDAPRFEVVDREGRRMVLTGLKIDAQHQRLFPDELIFVGSQRFSLDGLEIDPGPNEGEDELPKFALKELKYDVQAQASGEFVDESARIGAAGLRIGEQEHGPVAYDFSLKHLHARTLGTLTRKLLAMDPEVLRNQEQLPKALEPMKADFVALAVNGAILSIDRVTFRLPEGEVSFNASFRMNDGKAEDFNNPLRLFGKLDTTAELVLPGKSIGALLSNIDAEDEEKAKNRAEAADEIIAKLVRQDYVTDDNGILGVRLIFSKGQLLLNDKPFNPMDLLKQ
jgi:uncharacterized protein YdgA (DUF945 family)